MRVLRRRVAALLALFVALLTIGARAAGPVVVHLRIQGVVNPIEARYVVRAFERAKTEKASLVVVSINTPGGLVSSMEEMVSVFTNSPIPVVGLVEPRSAQATSAGAFLLLATDVAAMLPDTRMGAAHPVGAGEPLPATMDQKATNSLASLAKSLAARRGRPEKPAEAIVRDSQSFTAEEAKKEGLVELLVTGFDDLLAQLEGRRIDADGRHVTLSTRGAKIVDVPMTRIDRLLDQLADPTLASVLMTIGVLGILYELSAPGVGMAGIVGVTSLLLGLLAMSVLKVQVAGALLLTAGLVAIGLEVAMPSHGFIGAGGAVAVLLGAMVLVDPARYFGASPAVEIRVLLPVLLLLGAGLIALGRLAMRAQKKPPQSGVEALAGRRGTVKEALAGNAPYEGSVMVDGARWKAVSQDALPEGEHIEVIRVLFQPTRLEVRRTDKGDA